MVFVALVALAIEVNIFTALESFSEAGKDHHVLINCNTTSRAVPEVPCPKRIPPKPPDTVAYSITTILSIHFQGWSVQVNVQTWEERSGRLHHHFLGLILPSSSRMMMTLRKCYAHISYRGDLVLVEEDDMNDGPIKDSGMSNNHDFFSRSTRIIVLPGDLGTG